MAIRGSLKEASLPDVLQLLAMGKKTGCLSVSHRNNFGSIFFDRGRITYASIVNRRDRLGDMLVKNAAITQEQLELAIDTQRRRRDKRLGELLVELGSISQDQLRECIRIQIEEAVYFLFTWTQGTFNFEADAAPDAQDIVVSINPESLLLEGARRVDEWGLIEKKIPSFDLVFEVDRSRLLATDASLTPEQHSTLELVDGVRDVQSIVEASGLVEFEVGKALYALLSAGFIHRVAVTSKPTPRPASDAARVEEHRNLGVAFYKTGMFAEALREFRRVLELRNRDHNGHVLAGLVLARQQQWSDAAAMLSEAAAHHGAKYTVFHNLAYVLERAGRLTEASETLDEAMSRGGAADPRVHISLAVVHLLGSQIAPAEAALTAARDLFHDSPPTAVWYHYAGLLASVRGDLPRAIAILREGTAQHPRSATLANNLGAVLERRGLVDDARAAWHRALELDPENVKARANLESVPELAR
jgi:Flp pilus assembly protein TadD